MADDEQAAAGCDGGAQPAEHDLAWVLWQVHELCGDQVEGGWLGCPLGQILAQPVNASGQIGADLGGPDVAALQRDRRDVDRGDPPAALGQPDGVRIRHCRRRVQRRA